jgi:hypothetical protein
MSAKEIGKIALVAVLAVMVAKKIPMTAAYL